MVREGAFACVRGILSTCFVPQAVEYLCCCCLVTLTMCNGATGIGKGGFLSVISQSKLPCEGGKENTRKKGKHKEHVKHCFEQAKFLCARNGY